MLKSKHYILISISILVCILSSCSHQSQHINPEGKTIKARIITPQDYVRIKVTENSFASYLRDLPLKPYGSKVKLYNGKSKFNFNVYDAVVDLDIGNKDLHQCADAVMRLRAEYLWKQKQYDKIHFNFTNGFRVDYSEWMKGKRIVVEGNKSWWEQKYQASNSYDDLWNYMECIFMYAGTLSLSKELKKAEVDKMKIGDVFIIGGFPGHAVIVVDMAVHPETGKKLFLLAQSYMPAQEIQILKNNNDPDLSPWYPLDFGEFLESPQWDFSRDDLKRFR